MSKCAEIIERVSSFCGPWILQKGRYFYICFPYCAVRSVGLNKELSSTQVGVLIEGFLWLNISIKWKVP